MQADEIHGTSEDASKVPMELQEPGGEIGEGTRHVNEQIEVAREWTPPIARRRPERPQRPSAGAATRLLNLRQTRSKGGVKRHAATVGSGTNGRM